MGAAWFEGPMAFESAPLFLDASLQNRRRLGKQAAPNEACTRKEHGTAIFCFRRKTARRSFAAFITMFGTHEKPYEKRHSKNF